MFLILLLLIPLINARQLWKDNVQDFTDRCQDRRAIKCFLIEPILDDIENSSYITITGQGFDHITFHRVKKWELRGTYLSEWEVKSDTDYGYIAMIHNDIHIWGFFEYNGARYSIYDLSHTFDRRMKLFKLVLQWTVGDQGDSKRQGQPSHVM